MRSTPGPPRSRRCPVRLQAMPPLLPRRAGWHRSRRTFPSAPDPAPCGPADQGWARTGASFRTSTGVPVSLPPAYTAGAREMFCRDVYLRAGLTMPSSGWVIDLGANCGLFSVWAARNGAEVVAVEAQDGFADEIRGLAARNGVAGRVHIEVAMASGMIASGAAVGVLADDHRWSASSHGAATRPADVSLPQLISDYQIDPDRAAEDGYRGRRVRRALRTTRTWAG